jgi:hypothetical protein
MLTFSDLKRRPSSAALRGFRWVMAIGGPAVSLFSYLVTQRPVTALAILCGGLALALLSFVPGLGRWLFVAWMGLGLLLGRLTAPLLLGAVWLVVFVPFSIVFRLLGRDTMKRRFPAAKSSFWEPHVPHREVRRYFRQF